MVCWQGCEEEKGEEGSGEDDDILLAELEEMATSGHLLLDKMEEEKEEVEEREPARPSTQQPDITTSSVAKPSSQVEVCPELHVHV